MVEKIVNNDGVALPYRADVSKEYEVLDVVTHTISVFDRIDFFGKQCKYHVSDSYE